MIDGYALVEITPNKKAHMKELHFLEVALDHAGFNEKDIEEQLIDQLSEELSDALVMVFFSFECKTHPNWAGAWENEEVFEIVSIQVLKENYKKFYQKQVTADLDFGITGYHALEGMIESLGEENNYYAKIVKDWEALYNETFVPESK